MKFINKTPDRIMLWFIGFTIAILSSYSLFRMLFGTLDRFDPSDIPEPPVTVLIVVLFLGMLACLFLKSYLEDLFKYRELIIWEHLFYLSSIATTFFYIIWICSWITHKK